MVLYSAGVTEAQDAQEELFEEERLLEVVRANIARSAFKSSHQPASYGSTAGAHDSGVSPVAPTPTLSLPVTDVVPYAGAQTVKSS